MTPGRQSIQSLLDRALEGIKLVMSNAYKRELKAIREYFTGVGLQRSHIHL